MTYPRDSLRRSLILCLSITLGCGGYGTSEYERYMQKQKGFSDLIAAAGGKAKKEGKTMHGFTMTGWMIDLSGGNVTDQLIDQIIAVAALDPVFELNLSGTKITNEQLAKLDTGKVLQKTVNLDLSNTAITDEGLDKLANFYCITNLKLKGSSATKQGAFRLGEKKIASPLTPRPFKSQPVLDI